MNHLSLKKETVNQWMAQQAVPFSVRRRSHGVNFDPIPRILSAETFTYLERGIIQRISAMNLFLNDIYHHRMILRDGIIPEEFVFSSPYFRPQCMGIMPTKGINTHITATDFVCTEDGTWYAVEDSLAVPGGLTYTHFARQLCRQVAPEDYNMENLCDNCGLDILLKHLYRDIVAQDPNLAEGIVVLLGDGEDTASAFELRYMAQLTGAVAASADELIVMDNRVYHKSSEGGFQKVSIIHRLVPDDLLDPLCFDGDTVCGVPHLMQVYCSGNVAILNAPGCSVMEDKALAYFLPAMIRYYLDEEPILQNIPTYLPWYPEQREYILSNMDNLVFKEVGSTIPTGAVWGKDLSETEQASLALKILRDPRRYIAQEIIQAEQLPVLAPDGVSTIPARCDLRTYTVHSDSVRVWMGGLTRFTVPSSDGMAITGFKDTWVMSK